MGQTKPAAGLKSLNRAADTLSTLCCLCLLIHLCKYFLCTLCQFLLSCF